jgi:class 3 adenylate cyclase
VYHDDRQLTRATIAREGLLLFARESNNLASELFSESGPWLRAANTLGTVADHIRRQASRFVVMAEHFSDSETPSSAPNCPIAALVGVIQEFEHRVVKGLRKAGTVGSETEAEAAFPRLHDEAKAAVVRAREVLYRLFPKSRPGQSAPAVQVVGPLVVAEQDAQILSRVIVEVDVARYGEIMGLLESTLDVGAVANLNDLIEEIISTAARHIGAAPEEALLVTLGDGAFLSFTHAKEAHLFAEELFKLARQRNIVRPNNVDSHFYFRVGISSGPILFKPKLTPSGELKGYAFAGRAVAEAKRLEAAAETGEVLMALDTWTQLPTREMQARYGAEEPVTGKRNEVIQAKRWKGAGESDPREKIA